MANFYRRALMDELHSLSKYFYICTLIETIQFMPVPHTHTHYLIYAVSSLNLEIRLIGWVDCRNPRQAVQRLRGASFHQIPGNYVYQAYAPSRYLVQEIQRGREGGGRGMETLKKILHKGKVCMYQSTEFLQCIARIYTYILFINKYV